ncbi:DUF1858 domain-containing protein [Hominifimenecus sp. rT4P-3]|uniref:DUF1858 domain-containing protein n=1 Tax=Hominifimenecus sp. rT4P-3 TaxID=3242979 RepID=UPI003DA5CDBE
MKITEETRISELLQQDERAGEVLAASGLHCIGCLIGGEETLAEAAAEHGMDPVLLIRKLNLYLNQEL